jgi:hypothetical protein
MPNPTPHFVQPGQRFGRGVVVDPEVKVTLQNGATYRAARLRCDCGNEYTAYIFNIRKGNTQSCGCLARELRRARNQARAVYGRTARAGILNSYRTKASLRGYAWELTDEDFDRLTSSRCSYCGCVPSNVRSAGKGVGDFVYSGIDRVDNTKGYTPANTASCCKACNTAKSAMSLAEFEAWLDRIASFRAERAA